jgi:hypothetical protein
VIPALPNKKIQYVIEKPAPRGAGFFVGVLTHVNGFSVSGPIRRINRIERADNTGEEVLCVN